MNKGTGRTPRWTWPTRVVTIVTLVAVLGLAAPVVSERQNWLPAALQTEPASASASWCGPSHTVWLPKWWQLQVFKVSFCGSYFIIENTRTGQRWVEGSSGWFCRNASTWMVWMVTGGRYTRC